MKVDIPIQFVGGYSTILEAFVKCAAAIGDTRSYATELVRLLPQELKEASVWFDKIANLWRYEYGLPLDRMPYDTIIYGTNVHFPVNELYHSVRLAFKYLTKEQLQTYLKRMAIHEKHDDVIFEMRPMLHLFGSPKVYYEASGYGVGNKAFDWVIQYGLYRIAIEVKNRNKNLVKQMKAIAGSLNEGVENTKPPAPNPEDLFKDVEIKLKRQSSFRQLQGAWIQSGIKEDENRLNAYFNNSLDKRKVHFTILSDWKDDAYILARSNNIKRFLQRIFELTISNRFITQYNNS